MSEVVSENSSEAGMHAYTKAPVYTPPQYPGLRGLINGSQVDDTDVADREKTGSYSACNNGHALTTQD